MDMEAYERLLSLLREGHDRKDACRLSGFEWRTLQSWIRSERVSEYSSKRMDEVRCSESFIVDEQLKNVRKSAGEGNAKAAMWMLEALRPDRFGKKKEQAPLNQPAIINAMPALSTEAAKEKVFLLAVKLCQEQPEYKEKMLLSLNPPELTQ